jgi:hypothetical protein
MPISATYPSNTPGDVYGNPFRGPVIHTAQIRINVTLLTSAEVDAQGYLKPGVIFSDAVPGVLVGAAPAYAFGVVIEPIKVAAGNDAGSLAAASAAFEIGVGTFGQVNQDVIEDNLGRVLTANEIAGFVRAGSKLNLL